MDPKELENQTQTTTETEKIEVPKTEPTTTATNVQPSLEEVIALLTKAGNESLMQLAPVKELVQTARKQEKDKLYKSLEQKEAEAKTLAEKLEMAQAAIEKFEGDNLTFEQKLEKELSSLRKEHETLVKQLQEQTELAEKKARAKELEAYKIAKLREAGEEIIPELVGGTNEEEIDKSIELAKAKYHEIASKFEAQAEKQKQTSVKSATKVTNPSSTSVQPLTAEEINRMSPEEYAKNRDRILQALRSGVIQ